MGECEGRLAERGRALGEEEHRERMVSYFDVGDEMKGEKE